MCVRPAQAESADTGSSGGARGRNPRPTDGGHGKTGCSEVDLGVQRREVDRRDEFAVAQAKHRLDHPSQTGDFRRVADIAFDSADCAGCGIDGSGPERRS